MDFAGFFNRYHDLFSQDLAGPIFLETTLPFPVPVEPPTHLLLPAQFRNDLFGFGVTAYETLTGRLPWIMAQRLPAQARNPREFVKDLGENTARFLMKAIHSDLDHRFQSATEMKETLAELPAY